MRSTRASAAIDRLKRRSGNPNYSMVMGRDGLFVLALVTDTGASTRLSEPLPLDPFVTFVNAYGPQTPKRISKLDVAFQKQLAKKSS